MNRFVQLEPWFTRILRDPLDKSELKLSPHAAESGYGRSYHVVDGVYNFCPFTYSESGQIKHWRKGQEGYEEWSNAVTERDATADYVGQINMLKVIYAEMPIKGRCLDVGGQDGRVRAFLPIQAEFAIIDPFASVWEHVARSPRLVKAFPGFDKPVNFVVGMAEHLPFPAQAFDTVHMRSVIDHFYSPELALLEAHRVLKPDGQLIVGLYVDGGKSGQVTLERRTKDFVKPILVAVGFKRFADHHMWHPTFSSLKELINATGFTIKKTIWQDGYNDTVVYISADKRRT